MINNKATKKASLGRRIVILALGTACFVALLTLLLCSISRIAEEWNIFKLRYGSEEQKQVAAVALGAMKSKRAVQPLVHIMTECVNSSFVDPLHYSEHAIVDIGRNAVDELSVLAKGKDPGLRAHAVYLLGRIGKEAEKATDVLADRLMHDEDLHVRAYSASALGVIGLPRENVIAALGAAASDPEPWVRRLSVKALETIKSQ